MCRLVTACPRRRPTRSGKIVERGEGVAVAEDRVRQVGLQLDFLARQVPADA
jgi:hypothetical protein